MSRIDLNHDELRLYFLAMRKLRSALAHGFGCGTVSVLNDIETIDSLLALGNLNAVRIGEKHDE